MFILNIQNRTEAEKDGDKYGKALLNLMDNAVYGKKKMENLTLFGLRRGKGESKKAPLPVFSL